MSEENFIPRAPERPSLDAAIGAVGQVAKPRKRIITTVTVHAPGPENTGLELEDGAIVGGLYHALEYPPGYPVELDADEADRIIARHGGEVVGEDYEIPASVGKPVENKRRN